MDDWKIRDGNERDMEEILSLRKLVFGEEEKDKLDPRFWEWEFMKGPEGKALIYLVEQENKTIGHMADLLKLFTVQGETVLGTFTVDLMVHPDYRRKGIFDGLLRHAVQQVREKRGLFMTAFIIRTAVILGVKPVGWKQVVKLPVLVYPIRFRGILNHYLHLPPLSLLLGGVVRFFYLLIFGWKRRMRSEGIEIEKVNAFDPSFDVFWEKASALYPVMGVRNRSFLTWRYLEHPTRNYVIYRAKKGDEMSGYIVLRKVDLLNFNSAVIVDLLGLDEETVSALVEKGIQYSQTEGDDLLGMMVPQTHLYSKLLRKRGFLPSPKSFLLIVYPQSDREVPLSPESWYVNWGDSDVI
jgi:GNAT superfamily N-acetyltransferase